MRKGFSLFLLAFSFYGHSSNEILYLEKGYKPRGKNDPIVKKYLHPKNAKLTLVEKLNEMLKSGKYRFAEVNSIEHEDIPEIDENILISQKATAGWHFDNINAHKVANLIPSPKEVIVAVCDSGFEERHPDLKGRSVPGFSFVGDTRDTSPNTHHGTMVSGVIVGAQNTDYNSEGIAPFVKVMPLKITNKKGSTSLSTIVECIKYGVDHGAKVINVSFTGVQNKSIEAAGEYARKNGALLVYSAGNQGRNRYRWPDHSNVFVIGGTQEGNTRWNCNRWVIKRCGSNYGPIIDIVAPAKDVLTTRAFMTFGGEKYSMPNGTSFSAPIASAVAALIFSVNPRFTPEIVEDIMTRTTQNVGSGSQYVYGYGLIDTYEAVKLALKREHLY
jgi:thermitase